MSEKSNIYQFFPELENDLNENHFKVEKPTYIFCITPRTGSTALCSLLNKIPGFIFIEEFFNPRGALQFYSKDIQEPTFDKYLEVVSKWNNKSSFGIKTSWQDFQFLSKDNLYKKYFPNSQIIYLDRFEVENQAVSLFHSIKSKQWHIKKEEDAVSNLLSESDFDLIEVIALIDNIQKEKINWHQFFYENNIEYLQLHYEFYEKNMNAGIIKVLDFLKVAYDPEVVKKLEPLYVKKEKKFYKKWLADLKAYRSGKYWEENKSSV